MIFNKRVVSDWSKHSDAFNAFITENYYAEQYMYEIEVLECDLYSITECYVRESDGSKKQREAFIDEISDYINNFMTSPVEIELSYGPDSDMASQDVMLHLDVSKFVKYHMVEGLFDKLDPSGKDTDGPAVVAAEVSCDKSEAIDKALFERILLDKDFRNTIVDVYESNGGYKYYKDFCYATDSDIAVGRSFKDYLPALVIVLALVAGIVYGLDSDTFSHIALALGKSVAAVLLAGYVILWNTG